MEARQGVRVELIPMSSKITLSSLRIFVNDGIYYDAYCCNANTLYIFLKYPFLALC
jgi:hypothetical protein